MNLTCSGQYACDLRMGGRLGAKFLPARDSRTNARQVIVRAVSAGSSGSTLNRIIHVHFREQFVARHSGAGTRGKRQRGSSLPRAQPRRAA